MDFPGYEMNSDELDFEDDSCDGEEGDCFNGNERNVCDTCEKEFQSRWQYQKHMSEHKTCGLEGCTFTAHEKIIEKHIRMQHSSGLYDKIRNVITPEDIAKWVAERKKKYPSKENIEKRYQRQEEMIKRGETLTRNKGRFDQKNKTRFSLNRKNKQPFKKNVTQRRRPPPKKTPTVSLIDDKSDWNGTLFPFRGTNQLYNEELVQNESNDFDDNEWLEEKVVQPTASSSKITLNNALGRLMGAYNSSDDSENEDMAPKETPIIKINDDVTPKQEQTITSKPPDPIESLPTEGIVQSDDEAPVEQKIERVEIPSVSAESAEVSLVTHDKPNGKRKRKRIKKRKSEPKESTESDTSRQNSRKRLADQTGSNNKIYKRRRVTLLERLLASEIVHERNVLLQCVKHIVANNFFDKKSNDNQNE